MAKFNLDDIQGSSKSSAPKQVPKSGTSVTSGTLVFEDETMRVIERGKDWKEYVVYNYKEMPKEYHFQDNRFVRYGLTFSNKQAAERGFATAKKNKTKVVEIGESKMNGLNIM